MKFKKNNLSILTNLQLFAADKGIEKSPSGGEKKPDKEIKDNTNENIDAKSVEDKSIEKNKVNDNINTKEEEKSLSEMVNEVKDKQFLAEQIVSNNTRLEKIENILAAISTKLGSSGDGLIDSEANTNNNNTDEIEVELKN